jgi:phage replication O-like protein O
VSNPQVDSGFIRIATGDEGNDVLSALARARLTGVDYQIVLWVIRQTWGYGKKEDWISLTQFERVTGASRSYVCRAIERLVTCRILVTQKSPGKTLYSFNKRFSEWVVTGTSPVTPTSPPVVTPASRGSDAEVNAVVTPTSHTKDNPTKDNPTKERPESKQASDAEVTSIAAELARVTVEHGWWDVPYAEKTIEQLHLLGPEDRARFARKARVLLNAAKLPATRGLARKICGEIAGLVNDRGPMKRVLSPGERAEREAFVSRGRAKSPAAVEIGPDETVDQCVE